MTTTDAAGTRAVVEDLLGRIAEGDPERIAELYAESCDWRLDWPQEEHGRRATPWIRHRRGRADIADHYRELAAHHRPGEAGTRVERIVVEGGEAVVLGEIRQTADPTGRPYRARFALHLTVDGGRVTRHHVYEDSLAVAHAFAPGGAAAPAGGAPR